MTKAEARRGARATLQAVSTEELHAATAAVERHLLAMPELTAARAALLYAALPGEVPVDGVAAALRERGVHVHFPRCLDGGLLSLHRVDDPSMLEIAGRYGIREPAEGCPRVEPGEIDVALVPGLAWSPTGHRLGRGAGYYDRLLAGPGWRGFRCGVFLQRQEIPRLPHDPWDVPLDAIVTDSGLIRFLNE